MSVDADVAINRVEDEFDDDNDELDDPSEPEYNSDTNSDVDSCDYITGYHDNDIPSIDDIRKMIFDSFEEVYSVKGKILIGSTSSVLGKIYGKFEYHYHKTSKEYGTGPGKHIGWIFIEGIIKNESSTIYVKEAEALWLCHQYNDITHIVYKPKYNKSTRCVLKKDEYFLIYNSKGLFIKDCHDYIKKVDCNKKDDIPYRLPIKKYHIPNKCQTIPFRISFTGTGPNDCASKLVKRLNNKYSIFLPKPDKSKNECVVCCINAKNAVFTSCGHCCCCYDCYGKSQTTICFICRKKSKCIRIYGL